MSLQEDVEKLNKKLGPGSVMLLGSDAHEKIPVISTGSADLDIALGIGGVPRGRMIEITGAETSGKTTLCLSIIKEAQAKGIKCAFIDMEHALDRDWAVMCGVKIEDLFFAQPAYGEEVLQLCEEFASLGFGLVVVDSVSAMVTKEENASAYGKRDIAQLARLMSQGMRKLSPKLTKPQTTIIFINQFRIDVMKHMGDKRTTSGGEALKYFSSVRIWIGAGFKAKVKKNKVASPGKTGLITISAKGIDHLSCLVSAAKNLGIVKTSGSFLKFRGENYHGHDNFVKAIKGDPQIILQIADDVYSAKGFDVPEIFHPGVIWSLPEPETEIEPEPETETEEIPFDAPVSAAPETISPDSQISDSPLEEESKPLVDIIQSSMPHFAN